MTLLLNSTPTALWHDIIHEAEATCAIALQEDIESYLVFLLMRYTQKPEFVKQIIATNFLQGIKLTRAKRKLILQNVGDHCLLFAGLFPHQATKRLVKVGYFVKLGQSAYTAISTIEDDLYSLLAKSFVPLMDVLQSIRRYSKEYPDLLPLEAYELWNETGSPRALSTLKQYTQATPTIINVKR